MPENAKDDARFSSLLDSQPPKQKTTAERAREAAETVDAVKREVAALLEPFPPIMRQIIVSDALSGLAITPTTRHGSRIIPSALSPGGSFLENMPPSLPTISSSIELEGREDSREDALMAGVFGLMGRADRVLSGMEQILDRFNNPPDLSDEDLMPALDEVKKDKGDVVP